MQIATARAAIPWGLAAITLALVAMVWLQDAVKDILAAQAEESAARWVAQIERAVPDLPALVAGAPVTDAQRAAIDAAMIGAQVFEVQLFDRTGTEVFDSDGGPAWQPGTVYDAAAEVARSGRIVTSVEVGDPSAGMPARYVEIYMPIFDGDGTTLGVAELYIDKSVAAAAPVRELGTVSGVAFLVTLALLAVPVAGFLRQNAQLRRREAEIRTLTVAAQDARSTLEASIEALPHGFVLYDCDDRLVVCNAQYRQFYPGSAHAMRLGVSFETILCAGLAVGEYCDAVGREEDWLAERLARHQAADGPVYQHLADGRRLQVIESETPDGGRVGLRIDITDYVESRERAERAEQRLMDAINALPAGLLLFDDQDRLVMFNETVCTMYGTSSDLLEIGRTYEETIRAGLAAGQYPEAAGREDAWLDTVLQTRTVKSYELVYQLDNGRWVHSLKERTSDGGIVGFRIDITELKQNQIELEKAATTNTLTGLLNRRGAQIALQRLVDDLPGDDAEIAFLHIDLDRFKPINDAFGHPFGDRLLVHVASCLRDTAPKDAAIARVGGDEFLVAYGTHGSDEDLEQVGDRIRAALVRPIHLQGQRVRVGASVGVATWSRAESARVSIEDAMQNADIALNVSKQRGRNAVTVFEPEMRKKSVLTARIADDIAHGLEAGEFTAHFQPVFDAATGEVQGFEALARWRHPEQGVLTPAHFLPASEAAGHTPAIDRAVLLEAVDLARLLRDHVRTDLRFGINLAEAHLNTPDIVDQYLWLLDAHGAAPSQFRIEIVETSLLEERASHVIKNVQRFSAAGFAIDLDDFGTGHTAIATLRSLPVDRIKIDRSLVAGVDSDPDLAILTDAIVGLGRRLGLDVLAEGVERAE
jgi:diguanylate cyclase (GGDEF)-like protein